MFENVYRDRSVLVTGHTGFKGSWITSWLLDLGANVVGYSLLPPTTPSNFEVCALSGRMKSIEGDVRDASNLASVLKQHQPELVFHLAAQPLVRLSYAQPRETIETNVMGTVNLLEAVRHTPSVKAVINITSDKCYENREWVWGYRESDPMGGFDPYSSSKGCSELITEAYRRSFFNNKIKGEDASKVALASVRAGNVIGGGDWAENRLVPDCVKALASKRTIIIRNPDSVRPWQHVLEPLSGYLWLGAKMMARNGGAFASSWNFGPDMTDSLTVGEVAERIVAAWGSGAWKTQEHPQGPHEAALLRLDCSKAWHHLRWRPVMSLSEALDLTVEWYRAEHEGGRDMFEFTLRQTAAYTAKAREKGVPWAAL